MKTWFAISAASARRVTSNIIYEFNKGLIKPTFAATLLATKPAASGMKSSSVAAT
jgi:hypothetical protein